MLWSVLMLLGLCLLVPLALISQHKRESSSQVSGLWRLCEAVPRSA